MSEDYEAALELRTRGGRRFVHTTERIPRGARIVMLDGSITDRRSRMTVQLAPGRHIQPGTSIGYQVNHSCDASARFDVRDGAFYARRDIEPGGEITFNYCSTEEDMAEPFRCVCGEDGCYGVVRGLKHLDEGQRRALSDQLPPYLAEQYGA